MPRLFTSLSLLVILALCQTAQPTPLDHQTLQSRQQPRTSAGATFRGVDNPAITGSVRFTQRPGVQGLDFDLTVSGLQTVQGVNDFPFHVHVNKVGAGCSGSGEILSDLSGQHGALRVNPNQGNRPVQRSFTVTDLSFTGDPKRNPVGHAFNIHKGTAKDSYIACVNIA